MILSPLARELYDEIADLTIIDAHEHLPPEARYLSFAYSGLNLFAGYLWHDLRSAGVPGEFVATMREGGDRPVETWWPQIRQHWGHVRNTSYARALRITARDVFGIRDINDDTIGSLAEQVKADNTPGIYRRNLQERCRIQRSICVVDSADDDPSFPDDPGLKGIARFCPWLGPDIPGKLRELSGREVRTLDDATAVAQGILRAAVRAGAIGFKLTVADFGPPEAKAAEAELKQASRDARGLALRDYLFDKCCDVAAETGLPVAVHTGYWGDFRTLDPKFMLGFAMRRSDVRFDLFHLGAPMHRDAIYIGKTLPNVTLNLTWCPIISQVETKRALDEILDLVPLNKVIAFGGDYRVCVQKVYGHLVLAREAVAAALADRIEGGELDREEALRVARWWFYDNPARIYGLE
jgi:predicted TIM-barrel fold metal-dependent hydrolase